VRSPYLPTRPIAPKGTISEIVLFPDAAFGRLQGEIHRGAIPIVRTDIEQTSFERKMRFYLSAIPELNERHFGLKAFRVLAITTDEYRTRQ